MAFDVMMARAAANELSGLLSGGRAEKIYQPSRDTLLITVRKGKENYKLLLSASVSTAHVGVITDTRENPSAPPMFCMLMRKHLSGAEITNVTTAGFERVVVFEFLTRDQLGFECKRKLYAEIMGKCSNVVLTDAGEPEKIIGAAKTVDMSMSRLRQIIPGMAYCVPPAQDKKDPRTEEKEPFYEALSSYPSGRHAARFLIETYTGFSPSVADEIVYNASDNTDTTAGEINKEKLWEAFSAVSDIIRDEKYVPYLMVSEDKMLEYSFMPLNHFGCTVKRLPSFSALFEAFFGEKEADAALKSRICGTESIVTAAEKKLTKKLTVLSEELSECNEAEKFRKWGELLTASLYKLSGKARFADTDDYSVFPVQTVRVPLDEKLSPSQNAARYYKKYNKLKTARVIATEQLEKAKAELEYLSSVKAMLSFCETAEDVTAIRGELIKTGYIRAAVCKKGNKKKVSEKPPMPSLYITSSGRKLMCGKNNLQNDYLTTKLAKKSDYWFHVKGSAGSHVCMECAEGEDPSAGDFTEAAQLAAYFSGASRSGNIAVDYTRIRFVKKPSGSAPGHVIFTDYFTAYVNPAEAEKMKR